MLQETARWIVLFFGLFILAAGFMMLIYPAIANRTLRKAGSTRFINYAEITLRLIPAIALILCAENARSPLAFQVFGWIMVITSAVLYFVPRELHHTFSLKSADILKPGYFRLISPLAMLLSALVMYNAHWI